MINERNIKMCRTKMIWQIIGGIFFIMCDVAGVEMVMDSLSGTGENELHISIITCGIMLYITYIFFSFAIKNKKIIHLSRKYRILMIDMGMASKLNVDEIAIKLNEAKQQVMDEMLLLMDKGIIKDLHIMDKEEISAKTDKEDLKKVKKTDNIQAESNNSLSNELEIDIFDIG